jgi:hypothetical protein
LDIKSKSNKHSERRRKLEEKTSNHFARVVSLVPSFSLAEIATPGIALGSTLADNASEDSAYTQYCRCELDIRIGHGHDLLHLVRNAAVLHHHYTKQSKTARGIVQMKRFSDLQSRASKRKSKEAAEYTKNWKKIENLFSILEIVGNH